MQRERLALYKAVAGLVAHVHELEEKLVEMTIEPRSPGRDDLEQEVGTALAYGQIMLPRNATEPDFSSPAGVLLVSASPRPTKWFAGSVALDSPAHGRRHEHRGREHVRASGPQNQFLRGRPRSGVSVRRSSIWDWATTKSYGTGL